MTARSTSRWCVLVGSSWLLVGALARATDYYVSPTGDDSNSGTSPADAWQTIGRVDSATFTSGDAVHFEGGSTFYGSLYLGPSDAADPAHPLVVDSYGSGRATLDAGGGFGIYVYNAAGIELRDLCVRGSGPTSNTKCGVLFYMDLPGDQKLAHLVLSRLEVSGFGSIGVSVGAWASDGTFSGFEDVSLEWIQSHDNQRSGIETWGMWDPSATEYSHQNVYVGHCTVHDNQGVRSQHGHTGDGILLGGVDGAVVEYCEAFANGENNSDRNEGPVGIWAWDSRAVTIQYNESHHNRTSSVDGGGFDFDGGVQDSVMQYNYSHDNDGAGYLMGQFKGARAFANNTVRYNLSENDGRNQLYGAVRLFCLEPASNGVKNALVYNNTFYTDGANPEACAAIVSDPDIEACFYNNIFLTCDGSRLLELASGAQLSFIGNDYFDCSGAFRIDDAGATYSSLDAWRQATGHERYQGRDTGFETDPILSGVGQGGTVGNPQYLARLRAYRLLTGSPLVNAGIDLTRFGIDPGALDFFQLSIPQLGAFDVGASEFGARGR